MSTIKTETLSTPSNVTVPVNTVVNGTAKAWVNFIGTGTVAIRRAFNVASITDNSLGNYTVNFTVAMPDANYVCIAKSSGLTDAPNLNPAGGVDRTAATIRIDSETDGGGAQYDAGHVDVVIFS